jgi:SpoIID/LytB domain protein
MKRLATVMVMTLTLTPATASAQTPITFHFTGSGWGHGVGMTQYGARAMALAGRTADEIVTYYYTGTTVRSLGEVLAPEHFLRADPDPLWIGLDQNRTSLRFHVEGPGPAGLCKANDGEGACPTQYAQSGESWEFRALGGGACQFFRAGLAVGNPGSCRAYIQWSDQPTTRVFLEDLGYSYPRGTIRIRPSGDAFHVVLEVGIEDYLYGIAEMPSDWPAAALQAQALAARTYGVRQALKWGAEEAFSASRQSQCWCHLYDSTADQVYVGWTKEGGTNGANWVAAVQATAGRIVTHPAAPDSTVIIAYYSSSSGGYTESNVTGFGHASLLPYLVGVPDPWSLDPAAQNPYATWTKDVTDAEVAAAVGLDTVNGMSVLSVNPSGSANEVQITGTLGGKPITIVQLGRTLDGLLGLRSAYFSIGGPAGNPVIGPCDAPSPVAGFSDVDPESPHFGDINCLAELGITAGTSPTTYEPLGLVSRWQMAIFLVRTAEVLGIELPDGADQGFTDLGGLSEEAVKAVNQLRQLDITAGVTPTTYGPNGAVPRWQMALFLIRLHRAVGFELPSGTDHGFVDLNGLDPATITAINQLADLRVTAGTSATTFSPASDVTREQMATFLARLVRSDS